MFLLGPLYPANHGPAMGGKDYKEERALLDALFASQARAGSSVPLSTLSSHGLQGALPRVLLDALSRVHRRRLAHAGIIKKAHARTLVRSHARALVRSRSRAHASLSE